MKTLAQKFDGPGKREIVIYILYGLEWAWLLNSASGMLNIKPWPTKNQPWPPLQRHRR
ncbi:hypothetical protein NC653_022766 [Populus alba x Populus x berolinensis]|uniref:Uncharacterized protein n=1 Tax=Populus alba x Populus x berolinensis TaxID=444605 RepID=A0AAD6MFV6_9ROSI|nr:hypothetical protein NC653_022766 [Populus alba x Populus x berolinensis]